MDTRACTDDSRFIHEPRALWTVQKVRAPVGASSRLDGRVKVNKDHLRNVGRHPITLTHLLVCAIGYTFREYGASDTTALPGSHNSMNVANLIDVAIAAPFSRHLARKDMRVTGLPSKPSGEPSYRYVKDYASGLWGLNRWDFDRPLVLPRRTSIQFDTGPFTLPDIGWSAGERVPDVYTSVAFEETHTGMFAGNTRYRQRASQDPAVLGRFTSDLLYSDAFGVMKATSYGTDIAPNEWPSEGLFPYKSWVSQEANRGAPFNRFTGFSVAVDQITYDETIQEFDATYQDQPIAPLSTRLITRARVSSGGSGEWWWRPGAPLALVAPTVGPAQTYRLPDPIVLGPGEALEAEVQVPIAHGDDDKPLRPTYTLGLSLTGYASIEGP